MENPAHKAGEGTRGILSPESLVLRVLGLFEELERMSLRPLSIPRHRTSEVCAHDLWNGSQTGPTTCCCPHDVLTALCDVFVDWHQCAPCPCAVLVSSNVIAMSTWNLPCLSFGCFSELVMYCGSACTESLQETDCYVLSIPHQQIQNRKLSELIRWENSALENLAYA